MYYQRSIMHLIIEPEDICSTGNHRIETCHNSQEVLTVITSNIHDAQKHVGEDNGSYSALHYGNDQARRRQTPQTTTNNSQMCPESTHHGAPQADDASLAGDVALITSADHEPAPVVDSDRRRGVGVAEDWNDVKLDRPQILEGHQIRERPQGVGTTAVLEEVGRVAEVYPVVEDAVRKHSRLSCVAVGQDKLHPDVAEEAEEVDRGHEWRAV